MDASDFYPPQLTTQQEGVTLLPIFIQNHSGGDSVALGIGSPSLQPQGISVLVIPLESNKQVSQQTKTLFENTIVHEFPQRDNKVYKI